MKSNNARLRDRFWRWIGAHVVQEVPASVAHCEFDCAKPDCLGGEWHSCARRLLAVKQMAAASECA